jgi:magnesium chelatase family protein
VRLNAELTPRQIRRVGAIAVEGQRLLTAAMTRLGLSARGHDRALKVARTIADLAGSPTVDAEHCAEALQYRGLDRRWRP